MKPISNTQIPKAFFIFGLFSMIFISQAFGAESIAVLEKLSTTIFGYVSFVFKVIFGLVLIGIGYLAIKEPERLKEHAFKTGAIIFGCLIGAFAQDIATTVFDNLK